MSNRLKSGSTFFSKIDVSEIVVNHLNTLKGYRRQNYSRADIIVFFLFPLASSFVVVFADFRLNKDSIGALINVFSIFGGLLFNLLVLVYDLISKAVKLDSPDQENNLKLDKLESIAANISFQILLSVISVLLLVASFYFIEAVPGLIFSFVIFYLVALFILTLFMILKRIYRLIFEEIDNQRELFNKKL